jgi:phosphoglucosamine mutase
MLLSDDEIHMMIKDAEDMIGSSGRILVRASGTEPLIRIMAES